MALTMNEAYDEVLYLVCNVARTYSTTLTFRKASKALSNAVAVHVRRN